MKQLFTGVLSLALILSFTLSASAAGAAQMTFDLLEYRVTDGDLFDLNVELNPNGEDLDTIRAIVTFDPTILSAENASLTGEFNRNAPGNYLDNTTGKISLGGFTTEGPVTQAGTFATITFRALTAGEATVAISVDSKTISNGEEKIDVSTLGVTTVTVEAIEESTAADGLIVVESSSHPNDVNWYTVNTLDVSWVELESENPIVGYYWDLDQSSDTDPTTYVSADTNEVTIEDLGDGIHYFHIKGLRADGGETQTVHRRVRVDLTAPNDFVVTAQDNKLVVGEALWLTFATTDEASGVLQYQMTINDAPYQLQTSPLIVEDLEAGTYFFRIAAFDRAGNSKYAGVSVRVYPDEESVDRPDGYDVDSEIEAIVSSLTGGGTDDDGEGRGPLLITLVLGALAAFGIIYAIRKRKRK